MKKVLLLVAAAVMSVSITFAQTDDKEAAKAAKAAAKALKAEDMPEARRINELHLAGKDDEIPFKAMMLTTVVAEAARMVRLENAPDTFPMLFSAMRIGKIGIFGIPGEPFTGVGLGLKETQGYDLVLPCCNTNAKEGYFPMREAYLEGGYEARSSNFKEGVAERIITEGQRILGNIR